MTRASGFLIIGVCNDFPKRYRMILLEEGEEKTQDTVDAQGARVTEVLKKGMAKEKVAVEMASLESRQDVALRQVLRWRVRYFTDGAVLGSRAFVDAFFHESRERFGAKRKMGARKMRGSASGAAGLLWTARDLRRDVG